MHRLPVLQRSRAAYLSAFGSLCFFVGAFPWYLDAVGTVATNVTFAVGSACFTTVEAIGLLSSGRRHPTPQSTRGDRLDWWSAAVQSGGTILFLVSTLRALAASVNRPDALGVGWRGDALGSAAFLISSGLVIAALRHRDELWDVTARMPGVVWLSAVGSVWFAAAAVGSYLLPLTHTLRNAWMAGAGTILGAACFFVAAMLPVPSPGPRHGGLDAAVRASAVEHPTEEAPG